MIVRIWTIVAAGLALLAVPASAQAPDLKAFAADEAECTVTKEDMGPEGWAGWQRNYGNGYGDTFHFYNGQLDGKASLLEVTRFIDGSVVEVTRWCYRLDGTLATIQVGMSSPDVAEGSDGQYITREGRLYFNEAGGTVAVRGWVSDSMGDKIGAIEGTDHQVARGCNPLDLRLTVASAQGELDAKLGTIEGQYPTYEANEFDWCAVAEVGP